DIYGLWRGDADLSRAGADRLSRDGRDRQGRAYPRHHAGKRRDRAGSCRRRWAGWLLAGRHGGREMSSLDFSIVLQAWPYLWSGLLFSLALTGAAFVIGMILGTCFALVQHFEVPVIGRLVRGYIALIRSIPLILVLFWFFFLVPVVLGHVS